MYRAACGKPHPAAPASSFSPPPQPSPTACPPCFGAVEPIDDHTCWFETGAATFESLAMHLALLGVDFEVTGPEELVVQVRAS